MGLADPGAVAGGPMTDLARVVFVHASKTGGSTLRAVLRRLYRDAYRELGRDIAPALAELDAMPEARRERLRAVGGHAPYGVDRHLPGRWTTITLVRHPAERILSHYSYVLRSPESPLHERVSAAGLGLRDYVTTFELASVINNGQTRLLGGDVDEPFRPTDGEHLERALARLRNGDVLAGTTERFDTSLLLMARSLGWSAPWYVPAKVAPQRIQRDEIDGETLRTILETNALDVELHRAAAERLRLAVEALGPRFPARLARFLRLNGLRGRARDRAARVKAAAATLIGGGRRRRAGAR